MEYWDKNGEEQLMTFNDAQAALRRPLTFGDLEQIIALRFLSAYNEGAEALEKLPEEVQNQLLSDGPFFPEDGPCKWKV